VSDVLEERGRADQDVVMEQHILRRRN
jgi:hypothetical protein